MKRPKPTLAALLLTIVAAMPAAAEQAPLAPQPPAGEFCPGCLAYLEFPPLVEADPSPAYPRQDAPAPPAARLEDPIAERAPDQVASVKR